MKKKPNSATPVRKSTNREKPRRSFQIVGIGASAGGLEAFERFFEHMPPDSGMGFVLIPHLDPGHASVMPEILKRFTKMKVVEAGDGVHVAPNQVYTIPPNKDMAIFHGALQLTKPERTRGLRMPIDSFLRSLAEDQGENAICIILSGTGTDGSMGLRAVHGGGGMTMVQSADTAKYEGMPRSALDTGLADFVLPVDKMPEQLVAYVRKVSSKGPLTLAEKASSALQKVLMLLRSQTSNDFSHYKKSTIYRRIEKRMDVHNIEDINLYVGHLREHPDEVQALFKELLIGVTSFFRDQEAFEFLKQKILPKLLGLKPDDSQLRIWVPACATGEEAYSIAIIMNEFMAETKRDFKFQIFGTDIDEDAIRRARSGIYPDNIAIDVTSERLRKFFVRDEAGFRIRKEIRESVVFAVQNVIKDAPFTKLDLLSCRNLLIYLEPELQNRILPLFHYALKPGGILFLGNSESIGRFSEMFVPLDKKCRFFQTPTTSAAQVALASLPWSVEMGLRDAVGEAQRAKRPGIIETTQKLLLEQFVPPSVIVNEKGDIIYVHGHTGRYLEPAAGQPSMNVLEMARPGLRFELRSALHTAVNKKKASGYSSLAVKTNGGIESVNLTVKPIEGAEKLFLIIFEEVQAAAAKPKEKAHRRKPSGKLQERVQQLELDLANTKESLQASIEELQTTNEELRSTNEEYQSTNEELQSTNEELETSKEELQSVNEELVTVNAELQAKIDLLSRTEGDMRALLESINIGTIFLDTEMNIKRFTARATEVFHLIPTDAGRPLSDIRSNLDYESLASRVQSVLDTLQPAELELQTRNGRWYLMRIQPSKTPGNVVDGVAITFTDINQLKSVEAGLQTSRQQLFDAVDSITDGFFALDREWKFTFVNNEAEKILGTNRNVLTGQIIWERFPKLVGTAVHEKFQKAVAERKPVFFEARSNADGTCVDVRAYPARSGLCVYFHETTPEEGNELIDFFGVPAGKRERQ